jgi:flagellar biosynthesis protein FlhF
MTMRLRTFTGRTTVEAMGLVRAHLGPSAVIVSTQEDAKGSTRVTAALDDDLPLPQEPADDTPHHFDRIIATALSFHGVAPELSDLILRAAHARSSDSPLPALAHGLAALFRFEPLTPANPRPLLLVGPPGSGKTATAAKLAARAVLAGQRVRLMTTDMVRAGGVAQLAAFAKILGAPFQPVDGPELLANALASCDPAEHVIIDTSGVNPFSAGDTSELAALTACCDAEPVLIFAAGGDANETVAMAEIFRDFGCARLVVTRLDTVRRLGSLLSVANTLDLSFAEVGVAPDIADGLLAFTPKLLARLLLPKGTS